MYSSRFHKESGKRVHYADIAAPLPVPNSDRETGAFKSSRGEDDVEDENEDEVEGVDEQKKVCSNR